MRVCIYICYTFISRTFSIDRGLGLGFGFGPDYRVYFPKVRVEDELSPYVGGSGLIKLGAPITSFLER